MDNASIHKTKQVKATLEKGGRSSCYTPPYCPWFNPVEFCFSDIKQAYRKMRVHSTSSPEEDIKKAVISSVTPLKCTKYFDHSERIRREKILEMGIKETD